MKTSKETYIRILAIGDPASELYRSSGPLTGSWTEKQESTAPPQAAGYVGYVKNWTVGGL